MKEKLFAFFEKWMPFAMLICSTIVHIYIDTKYNITITNETYDKVLDAMITFFSIMLGFVGVLIGILFSIRNTKLVKKLFDHKSREKVKWYFGEAFLSGFVFIILSVLMYAKNELPFINHFVSFWFGLILYSLLCNYRIIKIIMNVVFVDESKQQEKKDAMDEFQKNKLRDKYKGNY